MILITMILCGVNFWLIHDALKHREKVKFLERLNADLWASREKLRHDYFDLLNDYKEEHETLEQYRASMH